MHPRTVAACICVRSVARSDLPMYVLLLFMHAGLQSAMKTDQEAVVLIELATEAMTAPQHKTQAVRDGDNIGKGKTRPGFWRSLMACFVGA